MRRRWTVIAGWGCLIGLALAARASEPGRETAPVAGTIRAECARFRLTLLSGGGPREVVGEKGVADLPPGSYFLLSTDTEFTDRVGRVWRVRGGMAEQPVAVRPGQET